VNVVSVRGTVLQQSFQGATELVRVQCADGLILTLRKTGGDALPGQVELEFSGEDAIPVKESPERT